MGKHVCLEPTRHYLIPNAGGLQAKAVDMVVDCNCVAPPKDEIVLPLDL